MGAPIELTLYEKGADPGPGTLYRINFVSLDLLQRALRLSDELDAAEKEKPAEPEPVGVWQTFQANWKKWIHRNDPELTGNAAVLERLGEFVVDAFGNQFTMAQLRGGAEFTDIMNVLRSITVRAQAMPKMGPTRPPSKPLSKKR